MRYVPNETANRRYYEENNFASRGIRWISSIRRVRENVGRFGPDGIKCLLAGFISLGVDDPDLLKEEVSDVLGYTADETVAAELAAALAEADGPGLWKQRADGTFVLN